MILCRQTNPDQKIFVCAPSNAAVDEIVVRLVKKGLISYSGKKKKAEVVRIGVLDYNPPDLVREHSLDYQVDVRMKKSSYMTDHKLMDEYQSKVAKLEVIKDRIHTAHKQQLTFEEFSEANEKLLCKLYKIMKTQQREEFKSTKIHQRRIDLIDQTKKRFEKASRDMSNKNQSPANRKIRLEQDVLTEAKII